MAVVTVGSSNRMYSFQDWNNASASGTSAAIGYIYPVPGGPTYIYNLGMTGAGLSIPSDADSIDPVTGLPTPVTLRPAAGTINTLSYSTQNVLGAYGNPSFTVTGLNLGFGALLLNGANPEALVFAGDDTITGASYTVSPGVTSSNNLLFGFGGDDLIQANDGDDGLNGGTGNDQLFGGDGNDGLEGGDGADLLNGGAGIDTVYYTNSRVGVDINLSLAYANFGQAIGDDLTGIENVTGSIYDDTLIGDSGANVLRGSMQGRYNDADWLDGRGGADVLDGGDGSDTASYAGSNVGVDVNLSIGYANFGDATGDRLISIENLSGSYFADTLIGDAGANALSGGNGNDCLGGAAGADQINGGAGVDTASYAGSSSGVDVNLAINTAALGDAAGDVLTSIENLYGSSYADALIGNAAANTLTGLLGNDWLSGNAGADAISGGDGNDYLLGGAGNDRLTGGVGNDVFVINTALNSTTNMDTIVDFNRPGDTIQLENAIFTKLTATGTLSALLFKDLSLGAQDANDVILYNRTTGNLIYDSNGLAAGGQVVFADLANGLVIDRADFVVI